MTKEQLLGNLVFQVANSYVGQKEVGNNAGWVDKKFEAKMVAMGWQIGWSWCAIFYKLCLKEALEQYYSMPHDNSIVKDILKVYTPSVLRTVANRKEDLSLTDFTVGSAVCWQTGNSTGHVGILMTAPNNDGIFWTIEGNTSDHNNSNGDMVMSRKRSLKSTDKFKLLGFIKPRVI